MHPVLFSIDLGSRVLPIGSYGAWLCAGVVWIAFGALRQVGKRGLDLGAAIAVLGAAVAGGCAGGCGLHALVRWAVLGSFALAVSQPGLSMLGALLGAGAAALFAGRRLGFPAAQLIDATLPSVAIGQACARLGCFFGGCCYGAQLHAGWAAIAPAVQLPQALRSIERHPFPIYEATALVGLALVCSRRRASVAGLRSARYLALYALLRIALDGLRGDQTPAFRGLVPSQLAAMLVLGCALGYAAWLDRLDRPHGLSRWLHVRAQRTLRTPARSASIAVSALVLLSLAALTASAERTLALQVAAPDAVLIHGGSFEMGSDDQDVAFAVELCRAHADQNEACQPDVFSDEQPRHAVWVGPYRIDRTEVSRGAYERCVGAGVCAPAHVADVDLRVALPQHPVTGVRWDEAVRYCAWLGGRLPTEAEWEHAARGSSRRRFPWGEIWNGRVANHGTLGPSDQQLDGYEHAAPVTAFADGKSLYGLLNMAGNAWELTQDRYDHDYYARSERTSPRGAEQGSEHVIRGGSWRSVPHLLRVTQRGALGEQESRPDVGFRCAYDAR